MATKQREIGKIRDHMTFTDEWATVDDGPSIVARAYWTKGGTYGPQCCVILWTPDGHFFSRRTTGCGYSKVNASMHEALSLAGRKSSEGSEPGHQIDAAYPGRRWHHAHG